MAYSGNRADLQDSDPEIDAEFTALLAGPVLQWEIFYADRTSVYGTTDKEWEQAPDGVQVVIWQEPSGRITVISMLDTFKGKVGTWIEDEDFDALVEFAAGTSRIVRGVPPNSG